MSLSKVSDRLLMPFYKVFARQIHSGYAEGDVWKVSLDNETNIDCHMVWIQGRVVSLNKMNDELVIGESDDTQTRVINISSSTGGWSWVQTGHYVQVIGQIVFQTNIFIAIKCTKLVNLSHNSHVEAMWEVEVEELHNLIRGKVQIKL